MATSSANEFEDVYLGPPHRLAVTKETAVHSEPFAPPKDPPPEPREITSWRIYLFATMACMGALMFGYNLGVIGGCMTLPSFHSDFNLPEVDTTEYNFITSNIVSCFHGGTFFGAIIAFFITERYGRIPTLFVASSIFTLGAALQVWSAGSLPMMYAGRFTSGLGIGGTSFCVPLYLAEIAPPKIRGTIVGMHEIGNQLSSCAAFWGNFAVLGAVDGSAQWMIPLAMQLIPGGLLFLACFILPESPRWLVKRGNTSKASRMLQRLRHLPADHPYLRWELASVKAQSEKERAAVTATRLHGAGIRKIFRHGDIRRIFIGIGLMTGQQLTGITSVNFFSPQIFRSIGFTGTTTGLFASGIYAIVKAVSTTCSLVFFIDRTGRKPLLLIGAAGASLCLWYIGGYIIGAHIDPDVPQDRTTASWVGLVMIYVYAGFFSIAWNGIPWLYCSEIYPGHIRALCVSITTAAQWLGQFTFSRATPYMLTDLGGGTYLFFAGCLVVIVWWVYYFLPETKAVNLEDMDALFQRRVRKHRMVGDGGEGIEISIATSEAPKIDADLEFPNLVEECSGGLKSIWRLSSRTAANVLPQPTPPPRTREMAVQTDDIWILPSLAC